MNYLGVLFVLVIIIAVLSAMVYLLKKVRELSPPNAKLQTGLIVAAAISVLVVATAVAKDVFVEILSGCIVDSCIIIEESHEFGEPGDPGDPGVPNISLNSDPPQTYALGTYRTPDAEPFQPDKRYSNGDHILFGAYEQDNDTSNGMEAIEWRILNVSGDEILLISEYCLDCKQFNEVAGACNWADSALRDWLNYDFIDDSFTPEEQGYILETTNKNPRNAYWKIPGCESTIDSVFCLSIDESEHYFSSNSSRKCRPTDYAVSRGVEREDGHYAWYWLRSPGKHEYFASRIYADGSVNFNGYYVQYEGVSVRPAMMISSN